MTEYTKEKHKENSNHKEYNKLLLDLYKENQTFLNKAIFGISTLAFPFLFGVLKTDDISLISRGFMFAALIGFFFVISLQIFSLKAARDGCDKSLLNEENAIKDGNKLFERARFLDKLRDCFFILSLLVIGIALFINLIEKKPTMSENQNEKNLQKSFIPPEAVNQGKRSFVPPKSSVLQNEPIPPAVPPISDDNTSQTQLPSSSSKQENE